MEICPVPCGKEGFTVSRDFNPVNFGLPVLRIHTVCLEEWREKYDLSRFVGKCGDCGDSLPVEVPFMLKDCRGLCAEPCSCGNVNVPLYAYRF